MGAPHQAQERRFFSYVDRGRYGSQMRRLLTLFPREQILALCAEDLRQDQAGTLKRVAAFLDIGLFPSLLPAREHRRPDITYPKMPGADERALVYAMLRHEMEELAGLTDGQCQRRSKSRPCGGVKPGHGVTCRGEWREGVARRPLPPALA